MKFFSTTQIANIVFGLVLCYVFTSCEKQEGLLVEAATVVVANNTPKVEEGRLKFSNLQEMNLYVKRIKDKPIDTLKVLVSDKSFVSHLSKGAVGGDLKNLSLGEGIVDTLDLLKNSPIEESYIAALLNEKRELEIGNDTIYKIGNDFCFSYNKADEKLVNQFYTDFENSQMTLKQGDLKIIYNGKLTVYGTVHSHTPIVISDSSLKSAGARVSKSSEEFYFNSDHRMRAEFYTNSYLVYATIGVKTVMQQYGKVFWFIKGWKSDNATRISTQLLNGGYQITTKSTMPIFVPAISPRFKEEQNNSESRIEIDYFIGALPKFEWLSGSRAIFYAQFNGHNNSIYLTY